MANDVTEKFRLLARTYAKKEGLADKLEEQKKIIFAELVNHYRSTEKAVVAAEYKARADDKYITLVDLMTTARTDANLAKADMKAMELGFDYWRTKEATKRQEMRL